MEAFMIFFIMVFLLFLFIDSIQSTPAVFNDNVRLSRLALHIARIEMNTPAIGKELYMRLSYILNAVMETAFIALYILASVYTKNRILTALSVPQIITCIYMWAINIKDIRRLFTAGVKPEDFPRRKWFMVINSLLDYIYYPVALCLLSIRLLFLL